jgi:hypothetical protein
VGVKPVEKKTHCQLVGYIYHIPENFVGDAIAMA